MGGEITNTAHRRILIVSEHRIGHGSGHLHRCARIAPRLNGSVDWLLPTVPVEGAYGREKALAMIGNPDLPVRFVDEPDGPYDMVILDRREASLDELRALTDHGVCVGIDIAGEARQYCSFIIDALETPPGTERPNIADPGLLHLPKRTRDEWPEEIRRIAVAFGGETSDGGVEVAAELTKLDGVEIFLVTRGDTDVPVGVHPVESHGDLPEKLADFDLFVTHYGLTPYEAVWARVPVLLKNPTRYHSDLSAAAGFQEIHSVSEIRDVIEKPKTLVDRCERIRPRGTSDIAALINELIVPERLAPPTGGARWQPAVQRFAERTFFRNSDDGVIYMQNFRGGTVEYDHEYFFTEYAKQYGKTYLQDFPVIRRIGERRIRNILKQRGASNEPPHLLDIGCAYGPFLQAAADAGCRVTGMDISCEATRYVEEELGFDAICGDIQGVAPDTVRGRFDIVTMWYVIEHFYALDVVLNRVRELLVPGGLFAFSTPNGDGISARTDAREFFRRSPSDHFTVLTPRTASAMLESRGFKTRNVRITGHHPERFPLLAARSGGKRRGVAYHVVNAYSRVARLGDTFELIAEYTG